MPSGFFVSNLCDDRIGQLWLAPTLRKQKDVKSQEAMSQKAYLRILAIEAREKMTAEEYQTEAKRITPKLRQTALRYMGDASLSEDIAQDVLLRLWQLLDELHSPMDGLAITMVRNECLMRIRRQPRTVGMEGHDMAEQPSANPMAEMTLSMLAELPPLQQTILRLRHIDGMEIGEIAALLHKEEAAVRQNLSRGRKTLRLWIIKKMKEEEI